MRRVIGYLVTAESLFALGGIAVTCLGAVGQMVAPHLVWVLISVPVVLGFVPWAFRIYRWRQRRRRPVTVGEWLFRQLLASGQREADPDPYTDA